MRERAPFPLSLRVRRTAPWPPGLSIKTPQTLLYNHLTNGK